MFFIDNRGIPHRGCGLQDTDLGIVVFACTYYGVTKQIPLVSLLEKMQFLLYIIIDH